ncbi:hypothetical protein F5Y19DRAFT_416247, partial [Xylariaceae sp. FL1651]
MSTLSWSAQQNFVVCVVFIVLTVLFVLLRFVIKIGRRQALQGPDWLCLLATAIFVVYCGLILNFIFNVSLFHSFEYNPSLGIAELTNLAKVNYTTEIIFGFSITAIKLSILWFYYLLFSVHLTLRWVIRAATIVCILWFVVATVVIVLQCIPVPAYWETIVSPEYCLEYPRVLFGYELTNLLVDVGVLCIPTATVWNLQLPKSKKASIMGIFLLGAVVCIFSILRLTAIWNPPNIISSFDFARTYSYSVLQLGFAIITSCLPTFGPLLVVISTPVSYLLSWYQSLMSISNRTLTHSRRCPMAFDPVNEERPWLRVGDHRQDAFLHTWADGRNGIDGQFALYEVPSRTILVNREIEI